MPMPPKFASSRAREIAKSGDDVRTRVRALTLQALDDGLDLKQVSEIAGDVVRGAVEGLKDSLPESRTSVLRQVVEGLGEGFDAAARSAAGAVKEMQSRGKTFKDKELSKAAASLKGLEEQFLTTVTTVGGKLGGQIKGELSTLADEMRRAGKQIRPHVEDALRATDGRVMELVGEAATTGAAAARKALGAALAGASGVLQGVSERVTPKKKAAKKPAPKKA